MSLIAKIKEGFWSHVGTTCAAVVVGLLGWISYQIAPALLPAIEDSVSLRVVLAILLLSVIINVALALIVWRVSRPQALKLAFGILWDRDKNPHCPVCKHPGIRYNEYSYGEMGYYCNPCKEVFHLADASGRDIAPSVALPQIKP